MASVSRKKGILGALVLSGVLISGAYIASSGIQLTLFATPAANAASVQEVLQAYAQKDSDHDGLPDWEEALYGTDPNNPHSFSPTLTDGQAVAEGLLKPKFSSGVASSTDDAVTDDVPGITPAAGSLTDQFAQSMFSQYMDQQSQDDPDGTSQPSDSDIDTFAQSAMQQFVASNQQADEYNQGEVQVSGSGTDALTTYAAAVEQINANDTPTLGESGLDYFSDAVEKTDPTALANVAKIGAAYSAIASDMMKISVPSEAQSAHLEIANAYAHMGTDFTNMGTMGTDPLRAYLGLQEYEQDALAVKQAFSDMHTVFTNGQVTIDEGDPGYQFLQTCSLASQ